MLSAERICGDGEAPKGEYFPVWPDPIKMPALAAPHLPHICSILAPQVRDASPASAIAYAKMAAPT